MAPKRRSAGLGCIATSSQPPWVPPTGLLASMRTPTGLLWIPVRPNRSPPGLSKPLRSTGSALGPLPPTRRRGGVWPAGPTSGTWPAAMPDSGTTRHTSEAAGPGSGEPAPAGLTAARPSLWIPPPGRHRTAIRRTS
jgi:hypothetical protein